MSSWPSTPIVWLSSTLRYSSSLHESFGWGNASGMAFVVRDLTALYNGDGSGAVGIVVLRNPLGAPVWAHLPVSGTIHTQQWSGFLVLGPAEELALEVFGGSGTLTVTGYLTSQLRPPSP